MTLSNYNKIVSYLDIIEIELNKIAKEVGHVTLDEFQTSYIRWYSSNW